MGTLYDDDILEWSERQARLLRQLASGQPGNEAPDWANIIEEVESVGRSQLASVRSLLVRALEHELKAAAWPNTRYVSGGRRKRAGSGATRPIPTRRPCASTSTSMTCIGVPS